MASTRRELDETEASRLQTILVQLARFVRGHDPSGLPMSVASLFSTIEANEDATLSELAAIEGVAPPTITRLVGELEDLGLVERTTDPVDRRVTRVRLTKRGIQQHAVWRAEYLTWFNDKLAALPSGDSARLVGSIDALERLVAMFLATDRAPSVAPVDESGGDAKNMRTSLRLAPSIAQPIGMP